MDEATTLLLIRHAHTEANEEGHEPRMTGWSDVPLSERGMAELECLRAGDVIETAARVVYASDSPRAIRTALAVANGRRLVPLRALREIHCGEVDGWPVQDVESKLAELWKRNRAQNDPEFHWPGGESYSRFRRRVLRVMNAIAARHRGETVAVVTHTGVIAQVVGAIEHNSPARWEEFRSGNCSVTTVEWTRDGGRVVRFDDRSHLAPGGA